MPTTCQKTETEHESNGEVRQTTPRLDTGHNDRDPTESSTAPFTSGGNMWSRQRFWDAMVCARTYDDAHEVTKVLIPPRQVPGRATVACGGARRTNTHSAHQQFPIHPPSEQRANDSKGMVRHKPLAGAYLSTKRIPVCPEPTLRRKSNHPHPPGCDGSRRRDVGGPVCGIACTSDLTRQTLPSIDGGGSVHACHTDFVAGGGGRGAKRQSTLAPIGGKLGLITIIC